LQKEEKVRKKYWRLSCSAMHLHPSRTDFYLVIIVVYEVDKAVMFIKKKKKGKNGFPHK